MSNTWILVADAARARLFELTRKGADPVEIACYSYPEGRSPGREQDHGRLPRVQESNSPSRHAIEPRTSLRDKHAHRFADTLSAVVQQGRQDGCYDKLILMGPPRFLGVLHARARPAGGPAAVRRPPDAGRCGTRRMTAID